MDLELFLKHHVPLCEKLLAFLSPGPYQGRRHRPKAIEALALKLRALGLSMGQSKRESSPAQELPRDRSLPSKE